MSATANTGDHSGRIELSDIGTSWEDTLTDRDLDEMMAGGEPVVVVGRDAAFEPDESMEGVVAAFGAGEKGVTARPDDKRQIVAWLVREGFHEAAGALTEWEGPAPRSMGQRLQEARELCDWIGHYQVMTVYGRGVLGLVCTRHESDDPAGMVFVHRARVERSDNPAMDRVAVVDEADTMLDELLDLAAAHEIGAHGDR